jgi:hypothetical protein
VAKLESTAEDAVGFQDEHRVDLHPWYSQTRLSSPCSDSITAGRWGLAVRVEFGRTLLGGSR